MALDAAIQLMDLPYSMQVAVVGQCSKLTSAILLGLEAMVEAGPVGADLMD